LLGSRKHPDAARLIIDAVLAVSTGVEEEEDNIDDTRWIIHGFSRVQVYRESQRVASRVNIDMVCSALSSKSISEVDSVESMGLGHG
jgi:hypothetical protein